ncbi:lysophospholipid acyltransferase family protein [Desulfuromonas sp.]|uniref:lysophospholipid acyltransferase family protein n=1 Tax=Desulfuromonas sp. TaxID=892 RepID=UPI0025C15917|nr:lysophospholipid acyltransferase family protein [Desulfuromonas sp.]
MSAAEPRGGRFRPAAVLMNLTVYPLLVLWTLLGFVIFLPLLALFKVFAGWETGRIVRLCIWIYGRGWLVIMAPFVRFSRQGFEGGGIRTPAVLVVNHLSFFDTYCMGLLPFSDVTFAVRAWPFKMLWYTLFMRLAGYLNVERAGWEGVGADAREVFARSGFLLFFPEGHRSRDGELQRFYTGAFRLAVEEGVPVVPLCLSGTGELLPPGRLWLQPARVRLKALAPVDPAGFEGPAGPSAMRKAVKAAMEKELRAMRGMTGSR